MTLILLLLVAACQVALLFLVYHKLSKAVQTLRHESVQSATNVFNQVEGLIAVYAEVRPTRALPKSRGWAASPDFLAVLIRLVQERQPMTVLECSSGFSTVVLAAALRNLGRGKVISLEHDPIFAEKTRLLLMLHGLSSWAQVVDAPLVTQNITGWSGHWYSTQNLESDLRVDMLVIDGPPHTTAPLARYPALPNLYGRLAQNSVIVLDDSDRPDELTAVNRWLGDYQEMSLSNNFPCEKGCTVIFREVAT